jgi:DGQHR domain-containing protein
MATQLTDTTASRIAEYRRRKGAYVEKSVGPNEKVEAETDGWELIRENKISYRYRKIRDAREQLENEFWRLLYEFGYPSLNVGEKFSIPITDKNTGNSNAELSVFGYDSETIVIAQCRALEKRSKCSLNADLIEISSKQKLVAASLRKILRKDFEQKIIWLLVTRNIEWSDVDIEKAKSCNIKIITEREMFYYKEIAKRIGPSARYQFHAEFLTRAKVAALHNVEVYAIKTKLGPHKVYTFFASANKILPIAFVNHRDLRDPNAAPSYQRLIQRSRLKQIADFIRSGGFFPNTVILNFKQRVRFDVLKPEDEDGVVSGVLTLPSTYKSAWIIDGQHRIYGYSELDEAKHPPLLPFLAFENITITDETKLFSDINSKQKRVEKKLLDEITGEIRLESADKKEQIRAIASRVFDLMRDDDDGPLGGKITGVEIKHSDASILTIPYLVDAVVQSGMLGRVDGFDEDEAQGKSNK